MISIFKKKSVSYGEIMPLSVDMHSHLLPGIDDGAKTFEESVALIKQFIDMGYKKLIMTPHIMGDFYRNTPEIILNKLDSLTDIVKQTGLEIELEAAAEYYLDEFFIDKLNRQEQLLSFGNRYVLFETAFMSPSPHLNHAIFKLQSLGYKPVLAHPERYVYLFDNYYKTVAELREKGVYIQINQNSLSGYYSKQSKLIAEKLIDEKMVDFIGSDCHGERHLQALKQTRQQGYYYKAISHNILNNSLLQ
jgi:tyrosine-protein phosphatase YwqE